MDLGREVDYTISLRTGPGGKLSAENVRVLPVGSIPTPKVGRWFSTLESWMDKKIFFFFLRPKTAFIFCFFHRQILGQVYEGTILRSMRSVNPDQQEYCGLLCVGKEGKFVNFNIEKDLQKRFLLLKNGLKETI